MHCSLCKRMHPWFNCYSSCITLRYINCNFLIMTLAKAYTIQDRNIVLGNCQFTVQLTLVLNVTDIVELAYTVYCRLLTCGTVTHSSQIFTIHLTHCSREIVRIFEADEAETFCFVGSLIADDSCFLERGIFVEGSRQGVVCHLIAKVTTE